ncbi:MAG: hypothetical protein ACK4RK_09490 [Gemmataceae bacterium]
MTVNGGHAHDGLARPHLTDQKDALLPTKGLTSRCYDVLLGLEWRPHQIQDWQRMLTWDMERLQRSFGLLAKQRPIRQQVFFQGCDVLGLASSIAADISFTVTVDDEMPFACAVAHEIVEDVVVGQHQPSLTSTFRQRGDDSLPGHLLAQPRNPLADKRCRETMALKLLPDGVVTDDREEAFSFGQKQHVPEFVIQFGPIDSVPIRAFGQQGFIHAPQMNGVLDPFLVLPGRSQASGQSLDAGF